MIATIPNRPITKFLVHSIIAPLLLAIAYSASIGGASTLIGTPTNIMLSSILSDSYNYEISFLKLSKYLKITF